MTLAQRIAVHHLSADIVELAGLAHAHRVLSASLDGPAAARLLAESREYARAASELRHAARELGRSHESTVFWPTRREA